MTVRQLHEWVTARAGARPEATAIVSGAARVSYGDLDDLSTRVAASLRAGGCRPRDRVGLLMPKSPEAIIGLLGIYKAGAIYVPLDPASPAARLRRILRRCEPSWLLAAGPVARTIVEACREDESSRRPRIAWLETAPPPAGMACDLTMADIRSAPARAAASHTGASDPAHILFTSGSTGEPKGVVITHANVIHFIEWATRYFGIDASDRLSAHPPLHFDLSFLDMFAAFAAGAELHLVPPELSLLPNKLAAFIRSAELTQWFSVPSVLSYMTQFDVVALGDFPSLRRLLWCGEVLPTPTLIYWMKRLRHVTFTNLYGPTETTIASSFYTVPSCPADPHAPIPIGRACDGEELLVLDDALQPVPPGEAGDLYISGVGLAQGYWRDPERTDAVFSRIPQRPSERFYRTGDLARMTGDGLVHFLGRKDTQIKSRGYRIELGEIEAALHTVGALRESAVVAIDAGGFEGALICAAYAPAGDCDVTPAMLRRELGRLVPGYMLPARWRAFDALPKNANGKIDRPCLKAIFEGRTEAHAVHHA